MWAATLSQCESGWECTHCCPSLPWAWFSWTWCCSPATAWANRKPAWGCWWFWWVVCAVWFLPPFPWLMQFGCWSSPSAGWSIGSPPRTIVVWSSICRSDMPYHSCTIGSQPVTQLSAAGVRWNRVLVEYLRFGGGCGWCLGIGWGGWLPFRWRRLMIGGLCVRVRGRWLLGPIVVCVGVIGGCLGVAIGLSGQFISLLLYDVNRWTD